MPDPRLTRALEALAARHHLSEPVRNAISDWLDDILGDGTLLDGTQATSARLTGAVFASTGRDEEPLPGFAPRSSSPERPPSSKPSTGLDLEAEERYERTAVLGRGGFGEVWRAKDTVLGREIALKVLSGRGFVDLLSEARTAARLQHPAIVTVHDVGVLSDGRLFYTMEEVAGAPLAATIADVHAQGAHASAIRRLVAAVAVVAQGLAHAHDRGVLHRDVKPHNILLGHYGEVRLVDFGVGVLGTRAYLAPEVAAGQSYTPLADQYSLGATLHHVLAGAPKPASLPADLAPDLAAVLSRTMHEEPGQRFPDCSTLAKALLGWLEGASAEERARALVADARARLPSLGADRLRASQLEEEARHKLDAIPSHAPAAKKRAAWALEDAAQTVEARARESERSILQTLRSALREAPHLAEAHEMLADHYHQEHIRLSSLRDPSAATALHALAEHDRGRHAAYLEGTCALTLSTEPQGARALLFRLEERDRRMVHIFERDLGRTPLHKVSLPHGSWMVALALPRRPLVRYPISLARLEHSDGLDPDGNPYPIIIPASLGPDDRYVPAGFWHSGTDERLQRDALPSRRVWTDGFVMRRFQVTHGDYLTYLDDLAAHDLAEQALALAPHPTGGAKLVSLDPTTGRFVLVPDAQGDSWQPSFPVCALDLPSVNAYIDWYRARTDMPWRLPTEFEWEKAARGTDGRRYPWGMRFENTYTNQRAGLASPHPTEIFSFPTDRSPYGVRGMAGNMIDLCRDPYRAQGPEVSPRGRVLDPQDEETGFLVARGGCWSYNASASHVTYRMHLRPADRRETTSFRLVRCIDRSLSESAHREDA